MEIAVFVGFMIVGLIGLAVAALGVWAQIQNRPQEPWPAPRTTRAQRRVAATRAWEDGDPDVTEVIPTPDIR
ncbi:hypothetical protein ABT332_13435 [Saccharomonospora azurea]|uniref:hypothetical protein n=1 Tax=Saccharomonospora azurea TaxID=40988 RepID=UPI0033319D28